jgi:hypothetical protein
MPGSTPQPRGDRWAPMLAGTVFVAGLLLLVFALGAGSGRGTAPAADAAAPVQPALTVVAGPQPAADGIAAPRRRATWAQWTRMYRPLYRSGDRAFGVSWLLLAAVHKQETGFSTSPGTYRGLNFAGCCAGPMQFNVTNGRVSTWDRFARAYRAARRPVAYPHASAHHPSVYDDFDAMMAAARLLASSGADHALDGRAWQAAYDYYGHDAFGVSYADVVVARARNWAGNGFSALSEPSPAAVAAVHADYGAAALSVLAAAQAQQRRAGARPRPAARDRRPRTSGADVARAARRQTSAGQG